MGHINLHKILQQSFLDAGSGSYWGSTQTLVPWYHELFRVKVNSQQLRRVKAVAQTADKLQTHTYLKVAVNGDAFDLFWSNLLWARWIVCRSVIDYKKPTLPDYEVGVLPGLVRGDSCHP